MPPPNSPPSSPSLHLVLHCASASLSLRQASNCPPPLSPPVLPIVRFSNEGRSSSHGDKSPLVVCFFLSPTLPTNTSQSPNEVLHSFWTLLCFATDQTLTVTIACFLSYLLLFPSLFLNHWCFHRTAFEKSAMNFLVS